MTQISLSVSFPLSFSVSSFCPHPVPASIKKGNNCERGWDRKRTRNLSPSACPISKWPVFSSVFGKQFWKKAYGAERRKKLCPKSFTQTCGVYITIGLLNVTVFVFLQHLMVMEDMLKDFLLGEHLLLVGNQVSGTLLLLDCNFPVTPPNLPIATNPPQRAAVVIVFIWCDVTLMSCKRNKD